VHSSLGFFRCENKKGGVPTEQLTKMPKDEKSKFVGKKKEKNLRRR